MAKANERQAMLRASTEAALRARAEAAEQASQQNLYAALLDQARATVRSQELGQRVQSLDALRRAAAITNTPELLQPALAALALPDLRFERDLPLTPDETISELNPSFERIALSRGGSIEIRSLADQRMLATLPPGANLPGVAAKWSHDGRFLAVIRSGPDAAKDSQMEVWDTRRVQRVLLTPEGGSGAISLHPRLPRAVGSYGSSLPLQFGIWKAESDWRISQ